MENEKILIIEDNDDLLFTISKVLKKESYGIFTSTTGEEGISILQRELIDLVLLDLKLPKIGGIDVLIRMKEMDPDILILMMSALTDAKPAIEAMKKGAYDYLMKPFELDELKLVVRKALETHKLKREVARLKREHEHRYPNDAIYGESPSVKEIRNLIKIVSETPKTSVLIQGESGTGKELVANAIHYNGHRADKPFIKLNCSAIPDNLLESELFGHEKGAFTDAKTMKKGLFELANGGTIFLDEISSMKLNLQPKILRVIESQTFKRIGGVTDIKIDVRVMAATNADLNELVRKKEFRDDLFYRLKVMEINIPPLRERREDILLLTKFFLQEFNKEFNRDVHKLEPKTAELLLSYHWPGNIRELKNVIERAVILCKGNILSSDYLPLELRNGGEQVFTPKASLGKVSLHEMEKHHILEVLKLVNSNKYQAAKILDISRSTLREKLKNYKIM
ncbi:sigma-54 dependent transcriptional regulator [bacterium]|nr:sigma-54 dependent transcriptional regulator [bacterium]